MSHADKASALPEPAVRWGALVSGRNAVYSLTLAGSVALHALNVFVAITIMPSVVVDIGGLDYYAWNTTLFVLASILGAALSARLLRAAGPRGAYLAAAAIFAGGTVLCAMAPSMPVLLTGRFVQGLGGGFLYALAYSVIRLVYEPALWGRAIGLISAMWGLATLLGPAVGGMFAEAGAWRAAFWTLLPLVAAFAILAGGTLPSRGERSEKAAPLPVVQLALLIGAVLALSAASVVPDPTINAFGVCAAVFAVATLVLVESSSASRLLPSGALSLSSPLGLGYAAIGLLVIGMQPEIFVPYLLQVLHGQTPLMAGYLAALMALGWTMGAIISAGLEKGRRRYAIVAGPICGAVGLSLLAATVPLQGGGDWTVLALICLGLTSVGFGIGVAWPHLVTGVFQAAPEAEKDSATAGITTVQLFATAFGAALAGMVANIAGLTDPGGTAGASRAAYWLFLVFITAPASCLVIRAFAARKKKI